MTAASLEKLPCHVDFPHISSIALFSFFWNFNFFKVKKSIFGNFKVIFQNCARGLKFIHNTLIFEFFQNFNFFKVKKSIFGNFKIIFRNWARVLKFWQHSSNCTQKCILNFFKPRLNFYYPTVTKGKMGIDESPIPILPNCKVFCLQHIQNGSKGISSTMKITSSTVDTVKMASEEALGPLRSLQHNNNKGVFDSLKVAKSFKPSKNSSKGVFGTVKITRKEVVSGTEKIASTSLRHHENCY